MRTDNLPINLSKSSSLTSQTQEIGLSNQLFGLNDSAESFGQMLSSQVQVRDAQPVVNRQQQPSRAEKEAMSRADSGKRLPDQASGRLEDKQRADKQRQGVAAEGRRAESDRADKSRGEQVRAVEHRSQQEQISADASKRQRGSAEAEDKVATEVASEQTVAKQGVNDPSAEDSLVQFQGELELVADATSIPLDDQAADSSETDIVIDHDLLAAVAVTQSSPQPVQQAVAQYQNLNDDADLLEGLSEEERLALSEATAEPIRIDGEGFPELDVNGALAEGVNASIEEDVPVIAASEVSSRVTETVGTVNTEANKAAAIAAGGRQAAQLAPEQNSTELEADEGGGEFTAEGDEFPIFEPKQDKKADMAALADKTLLKPSLNEGGVATPVQERLAALAKVLDKAAGNSSAAVTGKAVEAVDGTKATPFQRSLEQMARAPAAAQSKTLTTSMQAPLQSREWAGEMGQKLVMMVSSRLNSAQIQLNPREMGPIDVKVSVQQDHAHVVFSSHAQPTREALEQALPRLREMMEQNGVALGDVDVRDHDARESHQRQGNEQRQGGGGRNAGPTEDDAVVQRVVQVPVGLVDYYA